jgi:hypothetical protein
VFARRRLLAAGAFGLAVEFVLLALWQRNGYWDFSDGVYALTARELLHGAALYRGVAGAQPPPVYLVGAALLAIHDGLASLRTGMALAQLTSAVLVGVAVLRISADRRLALAAAVACPLLPIELHEHAQLIPETLAAPLLMAGALLVARREHSAWGGGVVALAAACKLAFVVPAVAIILAATDRRRAIAAFVAIGLILGGGSLLGYGTALWTETVRAQLEVGSPSLHYVGGLLAQALWNEWPLLVLAVPLVLAPRIGGSDAPLKRALIAAAAGGLVLALTLFKRGSYIDVLIVAEPPLLALAAIGGAALWRGGAPARVAVTLVVLVLAAQSVSIILDPSNPPIARRPGASSGLAETSSPAQVDAAVAAARRCPAGRAYSGTPYIAFLAGRGMPAGQPDTFMLANAPADGAFARRAAADASRCP